MTLKLLSRDAFREGVFARDNYKCVFCEKPGVDAHHLIERRLFPDGGYYLENGISVCEEHHLACEMTTISVEEGREAAGIKKICVPDQFYPEQAITKWGDYILDNGMRTRGELFYDESVQAILKRGNVLDQYTSYVKYGRTMHVPWSPGIHDDDKALKTMAHFEGKRIIVTLKMDGENTNMYTDHIHARSIDSKGGEERAWVKQFWSTIAHDIPEGWRICGENLWAKHSIEYKDLSSYFYGFSMWDERNNCLSWDETKEFFEILGITPVPVLYDGIYSEQALRIVEGKLDWETDEGYVIRLADAYSYGQFKSSVAKYVRAGHVQTTVHWRAGSQFTKNRLQG